MLTRRDEISNLDSPAKPYFEGEVGLTVRATNPFAQESASQPAQGAACARRPERATPRSARFTDSQPRIAEFNYGTWMGDMVIQAIDGGLVRGERLGSRRCDAHAAAATAART